MDNKLPELMIVFDEAIGNGAKYFYLRHEVNDLEIRHIDLDGCLTLPAARKMAQERGFEPTHWVRLNSNLIFGSPSRF